MRRKDSKNSNSYNFIFDKEYKIYNQVGDTDAKFHKFTEWHNYVYNKYAIFKNKPECLINFKHFLMKEMNTEKRLKDFRSTYTVTLISLLSTLLITYSFSLLALGLSDLSSKMQVFFFEYSAISYFVVAISVIGALLALFMRPSLKAIHSSKKICFYEDYITIINEILEETHTPRKE